MQRENLIYHIKFIGMPSGSKLIKTIPASGDINNYLSTRVISFLTNQLAVFLHAVKHLWILCITIKRKLHGHLEISWKVLFSY